MYEWKTKLPFQPCTPWALVRSSPWGLVDVLILWTLSSSSLLFAVVASCCLLFYNTILKTFCGNVLENEWGRSRTERNISNIPWWGEKFPDAITFHLGKLIRPWNCTVLINIHHALEWFYVILNHNFSSNLSYFNLLFDHIKFIFAKVK